MIERGSKANEQSRARKPLTLPAPYPQAVLFNQEKDQKKEQDLPAGWTEHVDEKTGLPYYYAVSTATTVWQRPSQPAPPAARF